MLFFQFFFLCFLWFILPSSLQLQSVIHLEFYIQNLSLDTLLQLVSSTHASLIDLFGDWQFYPNLLSRLPSWCRPFIKQSSKQEQQYQKLKHKHCQWVWIIFTILLISLYIMKSMDSKDKARMNMSNEINNPDFIFSSTKGALECTWVHLEINVRPNAGPA